VINVRVKYIFFKLFLGIPDLDTLLAAFFKYKDTANRFQNGPWPDTGAVRREGFSIGSSTTGPALSYADDLVSRSRNLP